MATKRLRRGAHRPAEELRSYVGRIAEQTSFYEQDEERQKKFIRLSKDGYKSARFRFRMQFGDELVGPIVVMTGKESSTRNGLLRSKYCRELEKNESARLGQWVHVQEDGNKIQIRRRIRGEDWFRFMAVEKERKVNDKGDS